MGLSMVVGNFIEGFQQALFEVPASITIVVLVLLAWRKAGRNTAIFTLLGLGLIYGMGLWEATMQTLALVLSSTSLALLIGIPLGVWTARSQRCSKTVRPILDFMQTMPAVCLPHSCSLIFWLRNCAGSFCYNHFCHATCCSAYGARDSSSAP